MKIEFTDREDNSVYTVIKNWYNIINQSDEINESVEDPDIKTISEDDEGYSIMCSTSRGEAKLYSTGVKKNGKIDMCLEYQDNGEKIYFYDCTATIPDAEETEDLNLELNINN